MANIKDVARACGVSPATVSYVLNNKRVLKQETRDRVWQAIKDLDYHPSEVARGLSLQRMDTIGVVFGICGTPQVTADPYLSLVLQGILDAASAAELNVTIFTSPWHGAMRSSPVYRDNRADGIIVVAPPTDSDFIEGLSNVGVPIVTIAADTSGFDVSSVDADNALGTRLGLDHLCGLGHMRIAHLAGDNTASNAQTRLSAFLAYLDLHELPNLPEYVQHCHFDASGVPEAMEILLGLEHPPSAVLAGNDAIAFQVINVCKERGIKIPNDLSVVGFDGRDIGASSYPPLTTIVLPVADLGKQAVRILMNQKSEAGTRRETLLLRPSLLVRKSTTVNPDHNK